MEGRAHRREAALPFGLHRTHELDNVEVVGRIDGYIDAEGIGNRGFPAPRIEPEGAPTRERALPQVDKLPACFDQAVAGTRVHGYEGEAPVRLAKIHAERREVGEPSDGAGLRIWRSHEDDVPRRRVAQRVPRSRDRDAGEHDGRQQTHHDPRDPMPRDGSPPRDNARPEMQSGVLDGWVTGRRGPFQEPNGLNAPGSAPRGGTPGSM